ncbi:GNAT family N-acetyltransferase [Paenibacillus sp. H1-7]|uniref:GNAT family N-acetyltransferase n=1 Tax=Paenibacillus sp. H1-7 TaxID=2282849 RepID=UPI0031F2EFD9
MIEFGGNRPGLAWEDESLSRLSDYYYQERRAYWVAIAASGKLLGGCGIAQFGSPEERICELQKMYLLPEARGTGDCGGSVTDRLRFAKQHIIKPAI